MLPTCEVFQELWRISDHDDFDKLEKWSEINKIEFNADKWKEKSNAQVPNEGGKKG